MKRSMRIERQTDARLQAAYDDSRFSVGLAADSQLRLTDGEEPTPLTFKFLLNVISRMAETE